MYLVGHEGHLTSSNNSKSAPCWTLTKTGVSTGKVVI